MRKYRGKAMMTIEELDVNGIKHSNGWVYGWNVRGWILGDILESDDEYIVPEQWGKVEKSSIGQHTGYSWGCKKEVWEGDIIEYLSNHAILYPEEVPEHEAYERAKVVYSKEMACYLLIDKDGNYVELHHLDDREYRIIGNMTDNPELLEG